MSDGMSGKGRRVVGNTDHQPAILRNIGVFSGNGASHHSHFRKYPKRAGRKIWGAERVQSEFRESNNCKDALRQLATTNKSLIL
jgi:hypothetical protein